MLNKLMLTFKPTKDVIEEGKLLLYASVVGVITGFGAVVFLVATHFFSVYVLHNIAGYPIIEPRGEPELFEKLNKNFNPILLVIITTVGGLISGILVYTFAPEAEGHGTDGAIDAYHRKNGIIRPMVPIIKMIASAVTLGSGGSGGREGPIAQIGAGFGSFFASRLNLSARQRRILLVSGMGAGVGAIFHAPMAGAIFGSEVLYKEPEMEGEVFIYTVVASIVAYSTFSLFFGWKPLFFTPVFRFTNPLELISYTILALTVGFFAVFYVKVFYGVRDLFKKIKLIPHIKPAIGGLLVGVIGVFVPDAISSGYGLLQKAIDGTAPIKLLLLVAVLKVIATSLTISSGGSAGVFGPSMVIGGSLGGAIGLILHNLSPSLVSQPASFVLVGMVGFFSAAANTPLSTIVMVTEMTGSYHLIVPAIWTATIGYIVAQKWTIYEKQVKNRKNSPAHVLEYKRDLLEEVIIKDIMRKEFTSVSPFTSLQEIFRIFSTISDDDILVLDTNDKLKGIITLRVLKSLLGQEQLPPILIADDVANTTLITTTPDENLHNLMHKIGLKDINLVPVVDKNDPTKVLGVVKRSDIIKMYNEIIQKLNKSV
ncbi:chloride channel protein [Hippea maritima]|uniref:Cl-channel voltage-gated family protein n=1 Tax=Hippea maritima (strain ATCC 700847 / DSM 10411 / MH2) TaxID=760142 RepID=F2LW92_HIPMA|nr:chloride channel protein [Hippea maritima]AEA34026.1 Cl- channel voltage-gated family protein [Hippea maritima DSM 10411]